MCAYDAWQNIDNWMPQMPVRTPSSAVLSHPEFLIIDKAFQILNRLLQEAKNYRSRGQRNLAKRKGLFFGGVAYAGYASAYHDFEYGIYR